MNLKLIMSKERKHAQFEQFSEQTLQSNKTEIQFNNISLMLEVVCRANSLKHTFLNWKHCY